MHLPPCCVYIRVFISSSAVAASSPTESRHFQMGVRERWGIKSAHGISGQRAGRGSPAGPRELKKGLIIICF